MVGVPKSRGCETCRRRKIKCDEERPSCSQCIKGNRKCPGYASRLKFQDEGPQLKKRYSTSSSAPSSTSSPTSSRHHSTSPEAEDGIVARRAAADDGPPYIRFAEPVDTTQVVAKALHDVSFFEHVNPLGVPLISPENRLAAQFLETIFPTLPTGVNLRVFGSFLQEVPIRLGTNQALDDAVQCLYVAHRGYRQGQTETVERSRKQYAKALRSLQQCITDRDVGVKPETLCATMLLGIYEMIAGTSGTSWVRHAGGTARLIELRGANHYQNPFERELLASQRGSIVVESILMRKDCFLDRGEWRGLFRSTRDQLPPEHAGYDELMCEMAKIPTLLRQATSLRQEACPLRSEVMDLRLRVMSIRESLLKYDRESLQGDIYTLIERPAKHPDSPWPTVIHFGDNYAAGIFSTHNACLILVNTMLENLPEPMPSKEHLHAESVKLSDRQMKVYEYAALHAPFGSLYMWFSLRAAYVVLDDMSLKVWVVNRLNESLAALQLSGFEAITLQSLDYYFGDFMGPVGVQMRDE